MAGGLGDESPPAGYRGRAGGRKSPEAEASLSTLK